MCKPHSKECFKWHKGPETCHYQDAADVTAHNLKTAEVHYHLRDKDVIASIFKVNQDESEDILVDFENIPPCVI